MPLNAPDLQLFPSFLNLETCEAALSGLEKAWFGAVAWFG